MEKINTLYTVYLDGNGYKINLGTVKNHTKFINKYLASRGIYPAYMRCWGDTKSENGLRVDFGSHSELLIIKEANE